MSHYDYGNARLRAMKSRQLSRRELDTLLETDNLQGLIAALTKTAYCESVEVALARTTGKDCIAEALRHNLVNTVGKVRNFYSGSAGETVSILLRTYDVHNLKTILRGLEKNASPGEILSSTLPIGELTSNMLAELARAPVPRAAIDLLASMGSPFAHPMIKLRAEHPGAGIPIMELALNRWYFQEAYQFLQSTHNSGGGFLAAIQLDADLTNLLTVLRFAHAPGERKFLREWLNTDDLADLFVGPGKLSFSMLKQAGIQETVDAAAAIIIGTPYESPIKAGLNDYAQSARLSGFEKQLKRFRLKWMSMQIAKDPLGIGVLLGYLALKTNEISNIRWIVEGINFGLKADAIRAELESPP